MALQPSLPPSNPCHDRGFRQLSGGDSPNAAASNALAQISAAQLLPRGIHSLYAQNPGALLGSGQAAGMALGSHTHTSLSSGLNTSSGPSAMGAARYLAGLGMTTVLLICCSPVFLLQNAWHCTQIRILLLALSQQPYLPYHRQT